MKSLLIHALVPLFVLTVLPTTARAQRASLYQMQTGAQPLSLEHHSWLYVPLPPARELQINDLVTIIVNQTQETESEGKIQRITQSNIDARLRNWIKLDHLGIAAAPQASGEPRARGSLDQQVRTNADLDTSSKMRFNITATIVDIRPNGNLVLEAHNRVSKDEEIWENSLTGVVRREDVTPQNTILSEKIAELSIHQRQAGHIRDAYTRGWLLRFYDHVRPF